MKDSVVIVTGGSSGIGKALAEEFGKHGSKLLITGRNDGDLQRAVAELRHKGIIVSGFCGDVSRKDDNFKMADEAIRIYGKIDVLINNAGISMRALFAELDLEALRKVMDINFFGVLYATQSCLPQIVKNKGSVIGISSIAGYRGLPGRSLYSASKFALNGFLESLRTEMIGKGVHVLTACPGFTASDIRRRSLVGNGSAQGESPRDENAMMSAEECARHIYRATVKRKKIIILTAQGKLTVFLNKWFPVWMDQRVYNVMAKEGPEPVR